MGGAVVVIPDDLSRGVDAESYRDSGGQRIVDSSVRATAVEETVGSAKTGF